LVGVEALARWRHPVHGWIPPDDFVAVAERSGLILPLGEHILRTAVDEFTERARGRDDARRYLSVNVSNRQLTSYTVELVRKVLAEANLELDALWLEITESAIVADPASADRILHELRDLGLHLAIDDFGTGYSSLLTLKRYPVELVKIDRSFIEGLGTDPDSDAIVTAVVRLAQSLNLITVAEGVENEVQHARLSSSAAASPRATSSASRAISRPSRQRSTRPSARRSRRRAPRPEADQTRRNTSRAVSSCTADTPIRSLITAAQTSSGSPAKNAVRSCSRPSSIDWPRRSTSPSV
jgi:EAL domain-containing protein (putative c-di-GMP-specific phosphodiesterase class I)